MFPGERLTAEGTAAALREVPPSPLQLQLLLDRRGSSGGEALFLDETRATLTSPSFLSVTSKLAHRLLLDLRSWSASHCSWGLLLLWPLVVGQVAEGLAVVCPPLNASSVFSSPQQALLHSSCNRRCTVVSYRFNEFSSSLRPNPPEFRSSKTSDSIGRPLSF